jgi:hypothetical protein
MTVSDERMAANQALFRSSNEGIREAARRAGLERIPFLCECDDLDCTQLLRLTALEYERVRRDGRTFIVVPGHEQADARSRVVSEHGGYSVAQKVGRAGEIAQELDPRGRSAERDTPREATGDG